ncbi:MAG TPA: hypothetical protein VFX19_00330, partial [Dehalococcoidia bacterium]|nr:hypothetical protein [Dehalococcoidia bacterium]
MASIDRQLRQSGSDMPENLVLERGRQALLEYAWGDASDLLTRADADHPLECGDLEQLAVARFLTGQEEASIDAWTRCYQRHVTAQEHEAAARCAFWAGYQSQVSGEMAHAQGWLAKAMQALNEFPDDCAERGYVHVPMAVGLMESGQLDEARPHCAEALATGRRLQDSTLVAMGTLCTARVQLLSGETEQGLRLLDEVMVSITAGEVLPQVAGIIYCATIIACQEIFDLPRAHEWTRALSRWCELQQGLVPFRGQCLVHRAELMQMKGEWPDALEEVRLARERLTDPPGQPALGMAYYEEGELLRLRGELSQAEAAFRHAHQLGHPPQPGLALLWLAQGKHDVAASAIRTALDEVDGSVWRARLLPGAVEILLAEGQPDAAHVAADELAEIATILGSPTLTAASDQ